MPKHSRYHQVLWWSLNNNEGDNSDIWLLSHSLMLPTGEKIAYYHHADNSFNSPILCVKEIKSSEFKGLSSWLQRDLPKNHGEKKASLPVVNNDQVTLASEHAKAISVSSVSLLSQYLGNHDLNGKMFSSDRGLIWWNIIHLNLFISLT